MMRKKALKMTVTFAALALLAICFNQIRLVKGLPADSMWTEPNAVTLEATIPVGFKFNITVYANLSVSSYTWQMFLTYNKNHLQATGCWYSAGAKSQWAGANPNVPQTPVYASHNATHNYVLFGETLLGVAETPPGHYSLAIVEFEVVDVPPTGQAYQSQIRLDIKGVFESYILDPDLNEILPLNFAGTTYIIDEFTIMMLLIALVFTTASMALLKNKWLKTKRFQHYIA